MSKRIVAIWFPYLLTERMLRRQPKLKALPFALATNERGRRVVKAVNELAHSKGINVNMVVADCRALVPELEIFDFDPEQSLKLLTALAEWCIRYSPCVSVDAPDMLILDASGCTHLFGGEEAYLKDIHKRFQDFGYTVRIAMADTIGAAWGVCKFGQNGGIIKPGKELEALSPLPGAALRLDATVLDKLDKLGLKTISSFIKMPGTALRRRFGQGMLTRIAQALGSEMEIPDPVIPLELYRERLPSLEPIRTPEGIEIAIKTLLETLCLRLQKESRGLRKAVLVCYRIDGAVIKKEIGTSKPTRNTLHLFKLFELKIAEIEPGLGIQLFLLEAPVVEELNGSQDALWAISGGSEAAVAELLDRIDGRAGTLSINRYLPAEHYWPERSYKAAASLAEKKETEWRTDLPRPLHVLPAAELIEVTVPLPDYPPLLFIYKNKRHSVKKADGPERIEQEWWIEQGQYRDYYCVEDQEGSRYWLFRSGNYDSGSAKWFLHGFFP